MSTKEKGFTLIELLAAFVILALLMTVTGVSINKQVKQSETAKKEQEKSDLFLAAETYKLQYPDGEVPDNCVSVDALVSNQYIKSASIDKLGKDGSVKLTEELKDYTYFEKNDCSN